MQRAARLDQRTVPAVDSSHRDHPVIAGRIGGRRGGSVIADRRDHDHSAAARRGDRALEQGIFRPDQTDGNHAAAFADEPAEPAGNGKCIPACLVGTIDIRDADRAGVFGCEKRCDRTAVIARIGRAFGKTARCRDADRFSRRSVDQAHRDAAACAGGRSARQAKRDRIACGKMQIVGRKDRLGNQVG